MKALKTNKEGYGAVRGRLIAPDRLVYEDNGKLIELQLTENVVETEYNDIVAIGQLQGDSFYVEKMEASVPEYGLQYLKYEGKCYITIIPKDEIDSIDDKIGKSGEHYKAIVARDNKVLKNGTLYITVFGEYIDPTDVLIILSSKKPDIEVKEFGTGYAIKKRTQVTLAGVQL